MIHNFLTSPALLNVLLFLAIMSAAFTGLVILFVARYAVKYWQEK